MRVARVLVVAQDWECISCSENVGTEAWVSPVQRQYRLRCVHAKKLTGSSHLIFPVSLLRACGGCSIM